MINSSEDWPEDFEVPDYFDDGMMVYVRPRGQAVLCAVVVACGDKARVKNELHGIDCWVGRYDCRIRGSQ